MEINDGKEEGKEMVEAEKEYKMRERNEGEIEILKGMERRIEKKERKNKKEMKRKNKRKVL